MITALRKWLENAERERDEAYERAAKVCEEYARACHAARPHAIDGGLGLSGFEQQEAAANGCAAAIRALAKGEKQQPQKTGD